MSLVVKIVGGTWETASRDKRELSVYREMGNEVLVMAKGEPGDHGKEDNVDGFKVLRFSTRPLGKLIPNSINRAVSLFQWAHYCRKLKPDFISGHDLMPGLTIGWISTWFVKDKPKLIYDSHEFEMGRNKKRSALVKFLIAKLEKILMKHCAFSIMVNDSIADEVQRLHKLEDRPIVVRSTPDYWELDENGLKKLGVNNGFTVMYHGSITSNRGIEVLIRLVAANPNIYGVILGDGEEPVLNELKTMAEDLGSLSRIMFHPAVPLEELWKYVGAADLSLMMISGKAKSYYYSLPNKFFESIQALTPIVASDFPEMKRLIDQYEIGLTCDPEDLDAVNACVEKMRTNRAFYNRCKENLQRAKSDLCWEKEKQVLIDAFAKTYQ